MKEREISPFFVPSYLFLKASRSSFHRSFLIC